MPKTNKLLILDFNRTLFDPDKNCLIDGAVELIKAAQSADYQLILLSKAAPSRHELFSQLGIADYFSDIILTDRKHVDQLNDLATKYDADLKQSYVLGDRAWGEIALGHDAGWPTIWYQAGRFAHEEPRNFTPTHTISRLSEALALI